VRQVRVPHDANVQFRLAVSIVVFQQPQRYVHAARHYHAAGYVEVICLNAVFYSTTATTLTIAARRPTKDRRLCVVPATNKRSRSTVRKSTGSVVTEIEIPTTDAVHRSFENFIRINEEQVRARVDEHRQLHRYVERTFPFDSYMSLLSGPVYLYVSGQRLVDIPPGFN